MKVNINSFNEISTIEDDIERLIILRKRLGRSQYQFAKDLGFSASYIGQVENRKFPFTPQIRERINSFIKQERIRNEENLFSNM
ncbi:helix-turn-helix domain-containing protein [Terribacillus sp. JSM ZJ617]|uniref:helix-turn-helix domain-containing protein n=1 Tax=Terribacillus TaxID=459532 RepID=UPI0035A8D9FF